MHMDGAFGDFAEVSGPFGMFEDDLLIEFFEFVVHGGKKEAEKKRGGTIPAGLSLNTGVQADLHRGRKQKTRTSRYFQKPLRALPSSA